MVTAPGPVVRPLPLPAAQRRIGRVRPPDARAGPPRAAVHGRAAAHGAGNPRRQLRGVLQVKKPRTPPARASAPAAGGLFRPWTAFWFTPRDPVGLHALRLLTGLLLLAWLLPLAGSAEAWFGIGGWFDRRAYSEAARLPGGPPQPFGWSVLYLLGTNPALLRAAYWVAVLVLFLFTVGF